MTNTDLAYIAGLFDGEAYIGVKKTKAYACQGLANPGYHARVQVRMVDESAIRFVADTLGGWYYREKAHCNNGRPLYCYQVSDKSAESILRLLVPYLRVKRAVTEVVLSLRDLQREGRTHRTKVTGYKNFPNAYGTPRSVAVKAFSDEYIATCESLYLRCRELNKVGARE